MRCAPNRGGDGESEGSVAENAVARSDKEWVNRVFSKIFFFFFLKERLNVR